MCSSIWVVSLRRLKSDSRQVGNEMGTSDPVFMKKHSEDLARDSGKWIDHSVWHGKAHSWEKVKWLIREVCTPEEARYSLTHH